MERNDLVTFGLGALVGAAVAHFAGKQTAPNTEVYGDPVQVRPTLLQVTHDAPNYDAVIADLSARGVRVVMNQFAIHYTTEPPASVFSSPLFSGLTYEVFRNTSVIFVEFPAAMVGCREHVRASFEQQPWVYRVVDALIGNG